MSNLKNFSKVRVLVIGDVMIDKYLWGDVRRISPEAPVPIVNLKKQTAIAGGAANVAANIAALTAEPYLVGLIGNDTDGDSFAQILNESGVSGEHLIRTDRRQTTVKTRIMAHNQQIARLDQETISDLDNIEEEKVLEKVGLLIKNSDAVVISDYGKGFLSSSLTSSLISTAKEENIPVMVDPKGRDYTKYHGATLITPNKFELAEVCGTDPDNYQELEGSAVKLLKQLDLDSIIVTLGEEGLALFTKDGKSRVLSALKRRVYDVTGAGDTFISTLAVAIAAKMNLETASQIANRAAGLVVEQLGTTTVNFEDLERNFA